MVSSVERAYTANPFTERGRITEPSRFTGRWRELSLVFDRLEKYLPVLIAGPPGIGKSSLLTHVVQSAAVNLDDPGLRAFYVDLSVLPDAAATYELIIRALSSRGNSHTALEIALLEADQPLLLCLDNTGVAIEAGWGEHLLESLARMARQTGRECQTTARNACLRLVVTMRSPVPLLSEPFATLNMGAITPSEIRLLIDAYLDGTDVQFTSDDIGKLTTLSAGHPAYLQRAAFHLFNAKMQPGYNWQAAYREEVHTQPVPGAMLPPGAFEGDYAGESVTTYYPAAGDTPKRPDLKPYELEGQGGLVRALLPLLAALLVFSLSRSLLPAVGMFILGIVLVVLFERHRSTRP